MPKIAYIDKGFRNESLNLINLCEQVIREYQRQGYSLTLRQVYYQMVARDIIPNNQRSYKNLGSLLNDARLAGLIDWHAIEDRTRNLQKRASWDSPGEILDAVSRQFHYDYWESQNYYVEVWVEKDALVGIVGQICNDLDVPYFSCRGYTSQSELWGAGQRLMKREDEGRQVILLHLGDHDPSGIDMSRDIVDRLEMFGCEDFLFERLALNYDQIMEYKPPPNPAKVTDSRFNSYVNEHGGECWELDALEPKVISDLIYRSVIDYRDAEKYQAVKDAEKMRREQLSTLADNYNIVADLLVEGCPICGSVILDGQGRL